MAVAAHPLALVTLFSALVVAAVGVASLRERPDPLAAPLGALLFGVTVWAAGDALGLLSTGVPLRVAQQLSFLGVALVPTAWLVLMVRYGGYGRRLTARVYALLAVEPVAFVLALLARPDLVWTGVRVGTVAGVRVTVTGAGPLWWANCAYSYLLVGAGVLLLADVLVRSSPLYRTQTGVLLAAAVVPLGTHVVSLRLVGPGPAMDFTAVSFTVTGVAFALALFHFDLLDLRPVARDALIEHLADGTVVVDEDDHVVDYNATAGAALGGDLRLGAPLDAVLSTADVGERVHRTIDGRRRHYQVESHALTDARDRLTGRVVYLRDVTALIDHQQRLSVLNRVLRHNVRNELGLVVGYVDEMETRLPESDAYLAERAREAATDLLDLSEKARDLERTVSESTGRETVAATAVVERVAARLRETYPRADVTVDADQAEALVLDRSLLDTALWHLAENAVVHSDRETPRVEFGVALETDAVRVTVADDGPGIPSVEHAVLDETAETSLAHGSGLGLWVVHWTVELSGGDLAFDERDPRGTRVTVTLDRPD